MSLKQVAVDLTLCKFRLDASVSTFCLSHGSTLLVDDVCPSSDRQAAAGGGETGKPSIKLFRFAGGI